MSEKHIVVPEGMLKAAEEGIECGGAPWVNAVLQTALLWLDGELEKMIKGDPYANDQYHRTETMSENDNRAGYNNAIRAVRGMFLAPQPQIVDTPFGKLVIDTRVPPGEIRLENWNGPTLVRSIGTGETEKNHG